MPKTYNNEYLHKIPLEIWENIINYIELRDIQAVACTCKYFNAITNSIWKHHCFKLFNSLNIKFDITTIPDTVKFYCLYKRISQHLPVYFRYHYYENRTLDFFHQSFYEYEVEEFTTEMRNYMNLKMRYCGDKTDNVIIDKTATFTMSLNETTKFMIVFVPSDISRKYIKHCTDIAFAANSSARSVLIIPTMLSLYFYGVSTYLFIHIDQTGCEIAFIYSGEIIKNTHTCVLLSEEEQITAKVVSKIIKTLLDIIKKLLISHPSILIEDYLSDIYIESDYDSLFLRDDLQMNLEDIFPQYFPHIKVQILQNGINSLLEIDSDQFYEIFNEKKLSPAKLYDSCDICAIDIKEYMLYGTDLI